MDTFFHESSDAKVSEIEQHLWGIVNILLSIQVESIKNHITTQKHGKKNSNSQTIIVSLLDFVRGRCSMGAAMNDKSSSSMDFEASISSKCNSGSNAIAIDEGLSYGRDSAGKFNKKRKNIVAEEYSDDIQKPLETALISFLNKNSDKLNWFNMPLHATSLGKTITSKTMNSIKITFHMDYNNLHGSYINNSCLIQSTSGHSGRSDDIDDENMDFLFPEYNNTDDKTPQKVASNSSRMSTSSFLTRCNNKSKGP